MHHAAGKEIAMQRNARQQKIFMKVYGAQLSEVEFSATWIASFLFYCKLVSSFLYITLFLFKLSDV